MNLVNHVEELVRVNRELKDRNEELEINMLSIPFVDDWLVEKFTLNVIFLFLSSSCSSKTMKTNHQPTPEFPISCFKRKISKQSNNTYLKTPSSDLNSESDIWCSFDDLCKVRYFSRFKD